MRLDSCELWHGLGGHRIYALVVRRFFRPYRNFNLLFARGSWRREFMIVDEALWKDICATASRSAGTQ